jgi:hypothetical protein
MTYSRAIASALRLIEAKGEACIWHKPADQDPAAKPWRDQRTGEPVEHDVSIAWFSPRDLGMGTEAFLAAIGGTEVPQGFEIGLMGAYDFEPLATDTIERGEGRMVSPTSIDRLAPNGEPILYFVKVKL